jgi:peroxiredoxin
MTWLSKLFGGKQMAALSPGTKAPQFRLQTLDGTAFSLEAALAEGPVLAVFFKISCPVCQYALPFFQRIHASYPGFSIVGVSQNENKDTADFIRRYGVTFPILLDDTKTFAVSNAYGLTNVPTAFWIDADGEIEISSVGWSRKDFEEMVAKTAALSGTAPPRIFQPSEQVADFRAG